ncbi:MAG TPA: aspartyl/asparaginyl beta-hydroxylase domain-containing protein [Rhodanobacteraceae bacterium]|nr:aspartyl/asparaginyl beta-hydroxylase domain-containing protein [Rhodanobacteraceae bacterium]
MSSSLPGASVDPKRIEQARASARQGRIAEAEGGYRAVLAEAPDTPEALNFVAMCALSRGDLAEAQRMLERAVELEPTQPEIWKSLGIVHLAADRPQRALECFEHALQLDPEHFVARLHRGAALERLGKQYEATANYYGAIVAAQERGQWMNEATTAPGLRVAVLHAMRVVGAGRRRLLFDLLEPLRERHGAAALKRVEQGLLIYLGDAPANYPDPRQLCKFFYVPGLRTQPYFERELFPWHAELEKHTGVIREELRGVLADPQGVEPFLGTNDNKLLAAQKLLAGTRGEAQWNSFFFHRHGEIFEQNARRCPRTTEVLNSLPLVHIREHAPEVLFSVLTPGAHILPHHGVTNTRLVTHLPLIVPEDCAIRVGGVEHAWQEGRCVTFDDTFEHEAWNRSDKVRVVMILDSWHPDLTEAEREAVALLVGGIGDFNRAADVAPPPKD